MVDPLHDIKERHRQRQARIALYQNLMYSAIVAVVLIPILITLWMIL